MFTRKPKITLQASHAMSCRGRRKRPDAYCNLNGPGDNFDLPSSHMIPALIRKTLTAKPRGDKQVEIWGMACHAASFLTPVTVLMRS
jgi:hypothetical protein